MKDDDDNQNEEEEEEEEGNNERMNELRWIRKKKIKKEKEMVSGFSFL